MGPGWRVGRIAGVELAVHPSWLVIAFLITYSLAVAQFPAQFPGWSAGQYWVVAVATALLFFASVLAHELSHALVARRFGLRVRGITLFIFGGTTSIDSDSRTPREEGLIALAGPGMSILLGGVFIGLAIVIDQDQLAALVGWLGVINLVLGAFNLIPGFPMDGGRVLRAVIWHLRGDRLLATRNAATVGRWIAYLVIASGVLWALNPGGLLAGIWLALIGLFLLNAAEATFTQAGVERSLSGIRVRDAMITEPPSVEPNELVSDLVSERLLRGQDRSFLVRHDDGGLAGIVTLTDVRGLPRDDWPNARVTDIMTRFADLATIRPNAPLVDALRLIEERDVDQLPVMEQGRMPVGLVTRRGILRVIEARMKLGL